MKQRAKVSLAVATILASGWASVIGVTACSSSSKNPSGESADGSTGGTSSGGSGSSSGGTSSGGACTINSNFGNEDNGTCAECASCLQATTCCAMINACYADPGCNALITCQLMMCNNNGVLPDGAVAPSDGDCMSLCVAAVSAGTASEQLYTNEDNCWEGCTPASTACMTACNCGSTGDDGGGDDGGGDDGGTEGGGAPMDSGGG
jgi:hypothetical protein